MENIELRSDEVQEILGTPPRWIVRWGISSAFGMLIIFAWLGWFYKYPEKVEAAIVVTSAKPPTDIIAPSSGYIQQLLVSESDTVVQQQTLAIIKATTSYGDVVELETRLQGLEDDLNQNFIQEDDLNMNFVLGETLQGAFSDFVEAYEEYSKDWRRQFQASVERYRNQIRKLEEGIRMNQRRKDNALRTIRELEGFLRLQQDRLVRNETEVAELQNTFNRLEILRREETDMDARINEKELEIERVKNEIANVTQQSEASNKNSKVRLQESINQLQSRISQWKQQYVITAQSEGVVNFFSFWTEQQYVNRGEVIMAISPLDNPNVETTSDIIGKGTIPIRGSGRVEAAQKVKVKFHNYPFHEFGIVEGVLAHKSKLPRDSFYTIEVQFPNGLETSFGRTLNLDQQMSGQAIIITQDKRFIERVFESFVRIFN